MKHARSTHTILHDPHGLIEADLPLDGEPYECSSKPCSRGQARTRWRHATTSRSPCN